MTQNKQGEEVTGAARLRFAIIAFTLAGMLAAPVGLSAQHGSGGGGGGRSAGNSSDTKEERDAQKEVNKANCPEIVGKHLLLERMTEDFSLTCAQQDKIEPLLHNEESVSKPLLGYDAFTPDEKNALMLKVKLAARVQIRPLLTPDQQKKSDAEAAALAESGTQPKKGGKKGATPKKIATQDDAFKGEQELSSALAAYTAFTVKERQEYILAVKQAARRDGAPLLTADQITQIDADIAVLQKQLQP
jgi:hypothetical protein